MSKINKVLYNVDQRDRSTGEPNTREEMWMARNNIGLDEVIGHATVTENNKEYKGIAPLGENGLVPAEFLPSFVNAVVNGYYYNGKFYRDATHTTEISPDANTTYVDITVADVGVGYRWTQESGYFQISSQNAFGALKAGNDTIHADQPMDLLTIVGDSGITVAVSDTRSQEQNGSDKLIIGHSNSIVAGRIGEDSPTAQINNTFNLPWASFDDQGHITATGSNAITIKNASTGEYGVVKLTSTPGTDENLAMTPKGVQTAIAALDANVGSTGGANVALTVTEADGVITGVSITKDDTAKAVHAHGNITSDGKVTTAAASKKAMLITNSSDQVVAGPAFGTETGDDNLFLNKNGNWISVPQVQSDWNAAAGSDAEILNKPTFENEADSVTAFDANTPIVVGYNSSTKKLKTRLGSALMTFLGISESNNLKSFSGKSSLAADADHAANADNATNATYATSGANGTNIESYFTANTQNITDINAALNNKQPLCNMYIDGTNASSGTAYTDTVNARDKGYAPMLNVGGIYLPLTYVSLDPNDSTVMWYHFEKSVSSTNTVYHRIVTPSSITNSDTTGSIYGIFIGTYSQSVETPYNDYKTAYDAGKSVYLRMTALGGDGMFQLYDIDSSKAVFTRIVGVASTYYTDSNVSTIIVSSSNVYSTYTTELASKTDLAGKNPTLSTSGSLSTYWNNTKLRLRKFNVSTVGSWVGPGVSGSTTCNVVTRIYTNFDSSHLYAFPCPQNTSLYNTFSPVFRKIMYDGVLKFTNNTGNTDYVASIEPGNFTSASSITTWCDEAVCRVMVEPGTHYVKIRGSAFYEVGLEYTNEPTNNSNRCLRVNAMSSSVSYEVMELFTKCVDYYYNAD